MLLLSKFAIVSQIKVQILILYHSWLHQTDATTDNFAMGQWVIDDPAGIRTHPYSTSASTNPLRYSSIRTLNEVHNIGEVWANLLHNVYAALLNVQYVAIHPLSHRCVFTVLPPCSGFIGDAKTNPDSTDAQAVFLHLFIDALALQPCNPTFPTARDAWIQADANRYGGANKCVLWKAFASRGLGTKAASHKDDATLPSGC